MLLIYGHILWGTRVIYSKLEYFSFLGPSIPLLLHHHGWSSSSRPTLTFIRASKFKCFAKNISIRQFSPSQVLDEVPVLSKLLSDLLQHLFLYHWVIEVSSWVRFQRHPYNGLLDSLFSSAKELSLQRAVYLLQGDVFSLSMAIMGQGAAVTSTQLRLRHTVWKRVPIGPLPHSGRSLPVESDPHIILLCFCYALECCVILLGEDTR